jgi:hypothetical protein
VIAIRKLTINKQGRAMLVLATAPELAFPIVAARIRRVRVKYSLVVGAAATGLP